ncbi:MAG: efflux RND transporter permease subunit [Gallionellaceae bacterium]|nr:efflux RND transporter permease subunit [Gallionellaceae bacterium]
METGSTTFAMKFAAGLALLLAALPALAWEAKPLREIAIYPERRAQAQVVSLNESQLAAELSARIVNLPLEPGQRVARGALVAQLDCGDHNLAAERARAVVQHERMRKLAAKNFVSRDALNVRAAEQDATRAEVAVNAADLKTAEANREKCAVRAADELKGVAARIPGIRDLADDDLPDRRELVLRVDADALRAAGVDPARVARLVRPHTEGEIVALARERGEQIEVRVRGPERNFDDTQAALADTVALPGGGTTTLDTLVSSEARIAKGLIKRYDLRRAITVEGDLDKTKTDTLAANNYIKAEWDKMAARHPGIGIDFSGELDDIQESLDSMLTLFLLGLGLIYLILATVPMAFTGVVFGLAASGNPLSLYGLYGAIALVGIAVNSAIVLIDTANRHHRGGMSPLHAVIHAARRRVVPILITSSSTIGSLLSLALGLGGKSLIWGPVASAIFWEQTLSTVLTLFVIPLHYRVFMRKPHVAA